MFTEPAAMIEEHRVGRIITTDDQFWKPVAGQISQQHIFGIISRFRVQIKGIRGENAKLVVKNHNLTVMHRNNFIIEIAVDICGIEGQSAMPADRCKRNGAGNMTSVVL